MKKYITDLIEKTPVAGSGVILPPTGTFNVFINSEDENALSIMNDGGEISRVTPDITALDKENLSEIPQLFKTSFKTDLAKTWTKIEMGAQFESAYCAINMGNGMALCGMGITNDEDAIIYKSIDYGKTWAVVKNFGAGFRSIECLEYLGNGIVLCGLYGKSGSSNSDVYRSTDFGETWIKVLDTGVNVYEIDKIRYLKNGIVWASFIDEVGGIEVPILYESTDYGATWLQKVISLPVGTGIFEIEYVGNDIILIGMGYSTGEGVLYRSVDGGINWTKIELAPNLSRIYSIKTLPNGIVLCGVGGSSGGTGDIYRSTDYGITWSKIEMGATIQRIHSIEYVGNGIVLCSSSKNGASSSYIFKSLDYGATWEQIDVNVGTTYNYIHFIINLGHSVLLCGSGITAGQGDIHRSVIDEPRYIRDEHITNFELELARLSTGNSYMEYTTEGENITQVDFWKDATKTIKLFTKVITYSGSNPTIVTTTNNTTGKILTQTIAYSGENILSVTKTVI